VGAPVKNSIGASSDAAREIVLTNERPAGVEESRRC